MTQNSRLYFYTILSFVSQRLKKKSSCILRLHIIVFFFLIFKSTVQRFNFEIPIAMTNERIKVNGKKNVFKKNLNKNVAPIGVSGQRVRN